MSTNAKRAVAIGGAVVAIAGAAFFLLGGRSASDIPILGDAVEPATCPLSGVEPSSDARLDRAAVAVKIENARVAYPLSGLERAEIVYEELVEGGVTRFMAIYHCTDTRKAGPVRSARIVDPAIMTPITRLLAFSGANAPVMNALEEADVVVIEENAAGAAMQRTPRPGLTSEHTLYANTAAIRKTARDDYDESPPGDTFSFGDLEGKSRKATTVTINFSGAASVSYSWSGDEWMRSQDGEAFVVETGDQIGVDNVLIEEHNVMLSRTIVDPAGNPSVEIADVTGSGRAVLFRDGRAVAGRWVRESVEGPVGFETKAGEEMVFDPGSIWIHLVPSQKGEVKGSFEFAK